jgi:hypothetical protein
MKKIWIPLLFAGLFLFSCSHNKVSNKKHFFPVVSFIKSQVTHVDTSLYSIVRLDYIDSLRTDTTYIPREQFQNLAKDFLELPDLTENKYQDLFTEDTIVDEMLDQVVFMYEPVKPENAYIKRQEVLINVAGDKVKSFIIEVEKNTKDSSVQKRMLWQVDRSFQIVTSLQKQGVPEKTSIMKVIWNDAENQ